MVNKYGLRRHLIGFFILNKDLLLKSGKLITMGLQCRDRHLHKIATVKIPNQRSQAYYTIMQHLFGTEISGNRRVGAELLETTRAGIIAASEAGVLKPKIAAEYRVNLFVAKRMRICCCQNELKSLAYRSPKFTPSLTVKPWELHFPRL